VRVLLDAGADPNAGDHEHSPALLWNVDVMKALLDAGADPHIASAHGTTALGCAAFKGHADAVRLLLDRGCDPNAAMSDGSTPIFGAASEGHTAVINTLLGAGADPDLAQTSGQTSGRTPLIGAVVKNHADAVKALLDGGATLDIREKSGVTALDAAQRLGQWEVANLLKEATKKPRPPKRSKVSVEVEARGLFERGQTLFKERKWDEARAAFDQVLARVPGHGNAQFFLGASLAQLGRENEALPMLESAAAQTPKHPDVHNTLGMVLGRLGRIQDGERHLAVAASLGHPQAREVLAKTGMTWCASCAAPRALADSGKACAQCGHS